MKQVLQSLRNGHTELINSAAPAYGAGQLLIATQRSLISAGTERMLVEFGQGNLLSKARSQPEKVRQVLDKVTTDGLLPTLEAVFAGLMQQRHGVGEGVTGFVAVATIGDLRDHS
jgi:hypothetical protein